MSIVYEFKAIINKHQALKIDGAIRITQFLRNKCLRFWMDNRNIKPYDLNKHTAVLAKEFKFADKLNSMARQAAAERTAFAIYRFFDNCKTRKPGKKGYPKFQNNCRSVEYKTCGWKLSQDRKYISFTDKCNIGKIKLKGTYDLHFYSYEQIKRVRIVKRVDGYYIQFCLDVNRNIKTEPTGKTIGLDVGLNYFYTDNEGNQIENPRYLRKSEKALKRLQRQVSNKKKGSSNRKKACKKLGKKHLKVQRQRQDFAVKLARCVVLSNDFLAYEDLKVKNMVRNTKLAKSINDVSWSLFTRWLKYFSNIFGKVAIAVPPFFTSQECSSCGEIVKKSLSVRTHICNCGCVLDRDENAAKNILAKGLKLTGYLTNTDGQSEINASGQINLCQLSESLIGKLAG